MRNSDHRRQGEALLVRLAEEGLAAEGERLLALNERLRSDPAWDLPAETLRRCEDTIRRGVEEHSSEGASRPEKKRRIS